jgi:hypothetical protein
VPLTTKPLKRIALVIFWKKAVYYLYWVKLKF